ncbi:MAG: type IV secretion system DotC family protein [Alphaproteobacteria bacterium]|jgi:defect-in-organelle-trafficking protein DotC|nr:type IV secretion system DotC family protein [Alphaproteobacteria bacterium]
MLKFKKHSKTALLIIFCLLISSKGFASSYEVKEPKTLDDVLGISAKGGVAETTDAGLQMREEALKEMALSYGALSGLVHRNWEIYNILNKKEIVLDNIFNFSRLMIPTHYGTLIEPPIISESDGSFLLGEDGMTASMTSKIYSIGENVKLVTTPRNWRNYLVDPLDLENPAEPDRALKPKDKEEISNWAKYVKAGWKSGVEQANDIFADSLAKLVSDYTGMIRYKKLLAQKMISQPYAVKENRGVTGNGNEIRIDDKTIIITNIPALNKSIESWEPTER